MVPFIGKGRVMPADLDRPQPGVERMLLARGNGVSRPEATLSSSASIRNAFFVPDVADLSAHRLKRGEHEHHHGEPAGYGNASVPTRSQTPRRTSLT
jgi:hypothetical protein